MDEPLNCQQETHANRPQIAARTDFKYNDTLKVLRSWRKFLSFSYFLS